MPSPALDGVLKRQSEKIDDFFNYTSGTTGGTSVLTDSGTAAVVADVNNGILRLLPSDGTVADNDEAYVYGTTKNWTITAGKTICFSSTFKITEGNTDDANVLIGMNSSIAANTLLDDGGGPPASYTGFGIFKVDGGTYWNVESSIAGTQQTNQTTIPVVSGTWVNFRAELVMVSSTVAEVTYWIDGQIALDFTTNRAIKHTITLGTAAAMTWFVGAKNGGANQETLDVDFVHVTQTR